MPRTKRNKEREKRIHEEIVVDAYGPEEQAMGWHCYLEDHLHFPFRAKCIAQRATSPLHKNQEVEVVAMAPAEECEREMFVSIPWERRTLAVPLSQLEVIQADQATRQAVED
jgi:hypothetical protein